MPIILGVDPGLNVTGYGVLTVAAAGPPRLREAGVVRTGSGSLESRLQNLFDGLSEVVAAFSPTVMAIEELYSHYQRPRTAILMGHARGVICLTAARAQLELHHYAATKVKKMLTGAGRAPKDQVQRAICREFNLPAPPEPPDVADALAIALCHYYVSRTAIAEQKPVR